MNGLLEFFIFSLSVDLYFDIRERKIESVIVAIIQTLLGFSNLV